MSQQFEQREEQLSKKDFTITQYEEIVSKIEEQILADREVNEANVPYFEPVSSPEVDHLLNIFLRLNARLKGVSKMLDDEVFEYTPEEKEEEDFKDLVIRTKDKTIETLKGEVGVLSDEIERLGDLLNDRSKELESSVKELNRFESIISEKEDEIGDLSLKVTNKDNDIELLQDKVDELETTVTDREAEIESLKASNTKKK